MSAERQNYVSALAEKYGERLKRFIFARSRNSVDVADVAQEVFLRLLRAGNLAAIRSPEAYLFTVASHVLHQHHLARANAPTTVDIAELGGDPQLVSSHDPSAEVDIQQRLAELERILEPLAARVRATVLLHRFAGYSLEEIARQLQVSKPTAKRDLAAGLAHCRDRASESPRA